MLILVLILTNFLYAADAEIDIVKKSSTLPKIEIGIAPTAMKKSLTTKIKDIIAKDLKVSGHFEVLNTALTVDYNSKPNMLNLSNKGTDLFLNVNSTVSGFGGYSVMIKLYDINSKQLVFNRTFTNSKEERYPFIAHRIAISVNKHLKAPPIDWMDKFVIFSQYQGDKKSRYYNC